MGVTFELYVKQKGRWNYESQFSDQLREAAIAEAKDLEPHVEAVKVILERSDAEGNTSESTIYTSERAKTGRLTAEQRQAASSKVPSTTSRGYDDIRSSNLQPNAGGTEDAQSPVPSSSGRSAHSGMSVGSEVLVISKLLLIVSGSFGFAGFVTWLFLRAGTTVG